MGVTVVNVAQLIRLKVMKIVKKAAETLWWWPCKSSPVHLRFMLIVCHVTPYFPGLYNNVLYKNVQPVQPPCAPARPALPRSVY